MSHTWKRQVSVIISVRPSQLACHVISLSIAIFLETINVTDMYIKLIISVRPWQLAHHVISLSIAIFLDTINVIDLSIVKLISVRPLQLACHVISLSTAIFLDTINVTDIRKTLHDDVMCLFTHSSHFQWPQPCCKVTVA